LPGLCDTCRVYRQGNRDRLPARGDALLVWRHAARAGHDLLGARARGGDVRFVYSPLDALTVARAEPDRQVVFFAVGFETTAPANAMAVYRARREGILNFSMLVSHVLVPPAMCALLDAPTNRV
jgi:hydrogenase expression/formation protein HypD